MIGFNAESSPQAVLLFVFGFPCPVNASVDFDHSLYCFGIMLSALQAPLIDSPVAMRLLTFLTIASLPEIVKRLLFVVE